MNPFPYIHQEVSGQGLPLVILHGLFGDADNFRSIALHLERHFQVIRLDLPAHGHSGPLDKLSFDAMAKAVLHHLSKKDINQCHLMGHSLGGKVAMQMAGEPGSLTINKLIIVDIAPRFYPPHHESIFAALKALPLNAIQNRGDAEKQLRQSINDAGVRGFLLKSLYRDLEGEYRWRFDLDALARDYAAIQQSPTFTKKIEAPTLFIKGGNSNYLGPQDELPIRTHFRHPQFKEIGGTGHWPHAEKPAVFTRLCNEFLTSELGTQALNDT